ncbi:phage tail protein [Acetobacter aceti]|uniref:Phage tail protein n=1 Tax=Acetobacter aceti TaxID=435 RepID=A0A1U9KDX9_ACEAC|nr:putative phage tail protein [Acetobacter aceti]AQS84014.1 phage tail protein [Acetobacter aceti]
MTVQVFLAESFAKALSSLLPGGRIWSREPDDTPSLLALALGQVYERHSARSLNLLTDAFPASTTELLDEWQQSVGLPDPCAGDNPTLAQQRSQIVARLTDNGGSSKQYFISLAAALGYTISIDEFAPSRFGRKFGGKFGDDDWACAWRVNMPTFTVTNLKFGDLFGKSFASWGDTVLQCELERIKPAHTVLIFNYES